MMYVLHNSVPYCQNYRTGVSNCDALDFYQKMFVSIPVGPSAILRQVFVCSSSQMVGSYHN